MKNLLLRGRQLPDYYFNKTQLAKGTKVELEHTNNKVRAKEIAKDHLFEHPQYYKYLAKMEKQLKTMKKSMTN